jgi:hypothetical protein
MLINFDAHFIGQTLSYIDPGSGSFIFQLLIAGAVGAIYTLRNSIFNAFLKVKRLFAKQTEKINS